MTPHDIAVRNATYRAYVDLGRAPTPAEVADAMGQGTADAIQAAWRRLHDAHALVLDADGGLRMLNPFSAVPTSFRVDAAGRTWYANCGWDAFGIGVVLRTDTTIHTSCPDCREPIDLDVRRYRSTDDAPVFHVPLPAREWWADIGYT